MTVEQEKVQGMLKEKLREKGWKVTRQRLSILQTLAEHKGQHLAAEDIFELMKDEYPEMGLATVYRTLQLLYEIQLIDRIHFNDGCIRYEIGHIFDGDSKHSHHHLICRTCGRVMPFEDDFLEDLEAQIEADTGFHVLDHELKFYGQCKECAEASSIGCTAPTSLFTYMTETRIVSSHNASFRASSLMRPMLSTGR